MRLWMRIRRLQLVSRFPKIPADPLRHQVMSAVLESELRIKLLGGCVVTGYFQMYGVNLERPGSLLDEFHRFASPALTAMTFEDEEFIDEGISA